MTRTRLSSSSLARMDRQRIFDRPQPPSFWAVLDEGVLRRRIGGAKVMHDQLVHLADMGERASIKIHVIPAEAGAHMGLLGAFAIAGFAGDAPGIVYFESPDEGQTTRDPATVAKDQPDVRDSQIRGAPARSLAGPDPESSW